MTLGTSPERIKPETEHGTGDRAQVDQAVRPGVLAESREAWIDILPLRDLRQQSAAQGRERMQSRSLSASQCRNAKQ